MFILPTNNLNKFRFSVYLAFLVTFLLSFSLSLGYYFGYFNLYEYSIYYLLTIILNYLLFIELREYFVESVLEKYCYENNEVKYLVLNIQRLRSFWFLCLFFYILYPIFGLDK